MRLKAIRVNADLTQNEMCKILGICKNSYLAIEKGEKHMTEAQAHAFSKACGCKISDLDCKVLILTDASTLS